MAWNENGRGRRPHKPGTPENERRKTYRGLRAALKVLLTALILVAAFYLILLVTAWL